jgi:lysophospholipase L1-like esterase
MLLVVVAAVIAYWFGVFFYKYQISKKLIGNATAYQKKGDDHSMDILVLGDSTGVGVGASRPEDSIAGRLATLLGATYVENRAVSGAQVADMQVQLNEASLQKYNVILIQVGANDVTHFHSAKKSADTLAPIIEKASSLSKHVYVMLAGNVGATTNFPPPLRPIYTSLTLQYHQEFAKMAASEGATYINLYEPPATDPFTANPAKYLAEDGFHPSSAGYELWFGRLQHVLKSTQ